MNILFIYFTGTYNTRYVANKISDMFDNGKNKIDKIELKKDSKIADLNNYDLLFVGYPIYGFNSQTILNSYLRKAKKTLKKDKKLDYIIFKNSGETYAMNNSSSRVIKRILNKRHFNLLSEYHFPMPYNIHFPFANSLIKQIIKYNDMQYEILEYNYQNGINHKIKSNIFYDIGSFFVSLVKIGGSINSFFYKVDKNKCTKCQKCIHTCPTNNIELKNGKIKFHHSCLMCMRCSFYCPTKAITIGLFNSWLVHDYYDLKKIEKDDSIEPNFITDKTKGFYKCYIKTFKEIESEYNKIKN